MSEAPVTVPVSEGRTETRSKAGRGRSAARAGSRSLKDALSEAGLDEAASIGRESPESRSSKVFSAALSEVHAPLMTPHIAFFDEVEDVPTRVLPSSGLRPASSVVSPPPWQRAAIRGRRRALLRSTFGWAMTLVVAGSIIGVAGRYLAVSPPGLQNIQAARQ